MKKTGNNNLFLRMKPNVFFLFFFVGSYKVGKLNASTSSGNLFACKQVLYSEPFRSVKETKALTSLGHAVKNPEVAMPQLSSWNQKTNTDLRRAC